VTAVFAVSLVYNLLVTGMDAFVLWAVARKPGAGRAAGWIALGGAAASFLALVFGSVNLFFLTRLLAYLLFLHGPLVLAGCAWRLRRASRPAAAAAALLALGLGAVAVDAFLVEPTRLEITRLRLVSPRLSRPLRIGVLADLQTDAIGEYERSALRLLMAEKPDLILLAGDYLQASPAEEAALRPLLRQELRALGAPLGVYAVQGNIDGPGWEGSFEGLPVTLFRQTGTVEKEGISVTGLGVLDSSRETLRLPGRPGFHVVVGHSPDFALGAVEADLLVAGHTHGGQVKLPGIGPLVTLSGVPRAWAGGGAIALPGGRTLVVSRGVGHERGAAPRLRFLCRPEIVVIDLAPAR
jgi:hypothetical protein